MSLSEQLRDLAYAIVSGHWVVCTLGTVVVVWGAEVWTATRLALPGLLREFRQAVESLGFDYGFPTRTRR